MQHEPDRAIGVGLDLDKVISAAERSDLSVRALARGAQDGIVLATVIPPVAEGRAVLTHLEAPLFGVAARRLSNRDAPVDAFERLADALRRCVGNSERRLRGDHPAANVDSHRVRHDGRPSREHAADRPDEQRRP